MPNTFEESDFASGHDQTTSAFPENPKPVFTGEWVAFALSDQIALAELIRRIARPGCRMAEVGSWLGTGSIRCSSRHSNRFRMRSFFASIPGGAPATFSAILISSPSTTLTAHF